MKGADGAATRKDQLGDSFGGAGRAVPQDPLRSASGLRVPWGPSTPARGGGTGALHSQGPAGLRLVLGRFGRSGRSVPYFFAARGDAGRCAGSSPRPVAWTSRLVAAEAPAVPPDGCAQPVRQRRVSPPAPWRRIAPEVVLAHRLHQLRGSAMDVADSEGGERADVAPDETSARPSAGRPGPARPARRGRGRPADQLVPRGGGGPRQGSATAEVAPPSAPSPARRGA